MYKTYNMIFKASLDKLAKGITVFITILFACLLVAQWGLYKTGLVIPAIITALVLVLAYGIAYYLRPIHYVITEDSIVIHRPFKDVVILKQDIKQLSLVEHDMMKGVIRVFGVGGLFGYTGKFANFKLGSMTWYATRRDKTVLVEMITGKKIIITPDEPERMVAYLGY